MTRRLVLGSLLAVLALASIPAASPATFIPGPNGKIAFTSGRISADVPEPNGGDAAARIYVADWPSGTPVQATTEPKGAVRHRQPSWSPDHTRIAYAGQVGANYGIWILDLRTGDQTEFVAPAAETDRPSWSPDGTKIAYGSKGDLWVKGVAPGSTPVQLTNTAQAEERPVWSPDGNTLYYNRTNAGTNKDLYKKSPVTAAGEEKSILATVKDEWQPSLSPDGKTLCFTNGPMSSEADLGLVSVNGGLVTDFAISPSGNINCVWSPDGTNIIYTLGTFGDGNLAERDLSGQQGTVPTTWGTDKHFDGNSDWATNFSPKCDPKSASIGVNQFTTITLSCTDPDFGFGIAPPAPDPLGDSAIEILTQPKNGTIGGLEDGKVIYTPKKDFKGTDSFTYTGEDNESAAPPATVTIKVGQTPPPVVGPQKDTTAPKISNIAVSIRAWRLGKKLASISKSPIGTEISFNLSEAAQATLSFQRAKPGRRSGSACVKPTKANATKKACTRYVGAGSLALGAKSGKNRVRFQGRLSASRALAAGAYRVVVGARDAAGNRAKARTGPTFTIVTE